MGREVGAGDGFGIIPPRVHSLISHILWPPQREMGTGLSTPARGPERSIQLFCTLLNQGRPYVSIWRVAERRSITNLEPFDVD